MVEEMSCAKLLFRWVTITLFLCFPYVFFNGADLGCVITIFCHSRGAHSNKDFSQDVVTVSKSPHKTIYQALNRISAFAHQIWQIAKL